MTPFVRGFEAETSGDRGGLESGRSCPGAKDNAVDPVRPAAIRLWNLPYTAKEGTTAPYTQDLPTTTARDKGQSLHCQHRDGLRLHTVKSDP